MKRSAIWFAGVVALCGLFWLMRPEGVRPAQARSTAPTAILPAVLEASAAEPPRNSLRLMRAVPMQPVLWTKTSPAARRAVEVELDPAQVAAIPQLSAGKTLELALFDDAVFTAQVVRVTHYPGGATGLTAALPEARGTLFLACCNGEVRASIEQPGGSDYYVRRDPLTGRHVAIEVDRERSVSRPCSMLSPAPGDCDGSADSSATAVAAPAAGDVPEGAVVVDVMIVYTPEAQSDEGGYSAIQNNIALAMERANFAHANSDTRIHLNLVMSQEVNYTESGNDETDLNRLTNPSDGYMDEVHSWRDSCSADFVCLFSDTATAGGLGWLLVDHSGRADHAFCLAWVGQTDTGYTLVHEWGHNMGCSHSKSQVFQPWSASYHLETYSAGWQWADTRSSRGGYCTVMTYEDANNDGVSEYIRVGYFSNPSISYVGNSTNATGHVTNADNARAMREMRDVYATYRTPVGDNLFPPDLSPVTEFPHSESFEGGYGHWSPDQGEIPWTRYTGATPSAGTGPSGSMDGDYYMYIESSGQTNRTAWLYATFDLSELSRPEIEFYFHRYGSGMGPLLLQVSTNGTDWVALWGSFDEFGDQWQLGRVALHAYAGCSTVLLRFVGTAPGVYTSDMALDAITVQEGDGDFDDDGLPDEWEVQYGGGPVSIEASDIAANGVNTFMESYIAGFDPADPEAGFRFTGRAAPGGFVVRWSAVTGRVYTVSSASNLLYPFQPLVTNLAFPQASYTDAVHVGRFYKVGVRLAE